MKRNLVLPVTSLLATLLTSFHLADDIANGAGKSTVQDLLMVAILAIWLYGTLVLPERRSGHVIMLLGSLAGLTVFLVHLTSTAGLSGGEAGKLSGAFFFAWTLLALAATSIISLILSALGLWSLLRSKAQ